MSTQLHCPECGGEIVHGHPCPKCLLRLPLSDTIPYESLGDSAARDVLPTANGRIGNYHLIRILGEGGMGVVYEAEQHHPRRTVALKVIRPGRTTPDLLRRFEQEAQALGRLQHPGIAQIYEAGMTNTGMGPQPFFAMEFIRGATLCDYAHERQMNTPQRLELMARISEAVHHAHQRGIIHRDLKPGNIVVDESGQPKILDFGIARVTDSEAHTTRQTDVGSLVGTLAYMSPEQVLADPLELDTRSDVYALGVILYELLAGRLPYAVSSNLPEAVRTIREEDPVPLSSINRTYRGDIETIAATALEKDKGRRYASAADVAGDIRRYLGDEPITARPPSASYQLQKFARRHKALVAGIAAVFIVLVAGIMASTWQARRATRAEQAAIADRNRALAAEAQAKEVNDFLQKDLLSQASAYGQAAPDVKPDLDLKVRTALDRAAARVQGRFDKQPLVEASIRQTIANTYQDLGLYPEAEQQFEGALDLRRRVLGEEHPDTLAIGNNLAVLYRYQGKYDEAEALLTKTLAVKERVLGDEHKDTLATRGNLGLVYHDQGKYAQAEQMLVKVMDVERRILGEDDENTLIGTNNLATTYMEMGKYAQAEALLTRVGDAWRRRGGNEHPEFMVAMGNLAAVYFRQGKYAQAEPVFGSLMETMRSVLGEEHPQTLTIENNLALTYRELAKYAQAEALLTKVVAAQNRVLGKEHPNNLRSMIGLSVVYQRQGKLAQAESLYVRTLPSLRRVLGPEDPATLDVLRLLGGLYREEGKYTQAEPLLREALNGLTKTNPDVWKRFEVQSLLGSSLAGQKKYAEAEPLLLSGYEGMVRLEAGIPAASKSSLTRAGEWIVKLYEDSGQPAKTAQWRNKIQK